MYVTCSTCNYYSNLMALTLCIVTCPGNAHFISVRQVSVHAANYAAAADAAALGNLLVKN